MYHLLAVLLLLLTSPARADMFPNAANAKMPEARLNLAIDDASRTLWSSLGVKADGVTDNTAALNALPTTAPILADCKQGSFIRYDGQWNLKSNLNIKWQAGCRMVSYLQGNGTFAISHADVYTVPLTNVVLDGLTITKDAQRAGVERILLAWINHLKILNWTVTPPNSGFMFLRGSCQEIARNSFVTGLLTAGAPGIRHIGNVPKVADACDQVADVWAHDNHIMSGDAAYQSCQPLEDFTGNPWINISTDDILYENNTGQGGTFGLIGNASVGTANAFSCKKVVYRNNMGRGHDRGYLVGSNGSLVSNVLIANQDLDASLSVINPGHINVRGDLDPARPGTFENITFDGVSVRNTGVQAILVVVPSAGSLTGLAVKGGIFDAPTRTTGGGSWSTPVVINGGSNITFQDNVFHGAHLGAGAIVSVGNDDGVSDARTVTGFSFVNNFIDQIPSNAVALFLKNAASPVIVGNTFLKVSGATATKGIQLSDSYPLPTSGTGPGTTSATVSHNTVNDLTTPIMWTCNGGNTSFKIYNAGDADFVCPSVSALDYNFSTATYSQPAEAGCVSFATCVTFARAQSPAATRSTDLLYTSPADEPYTQYDDDVPRIVPGRGLLVERQAINYLLNSTVPVTQTTASLAVGDYVLWTNGGGSAAATANTAVGTGLTGSASQGVPQYFSVTTAGTVDVTVTGALSAFQLEEGTYPTSLILTTAADGTRGIDVATVTVTPTIGAEYSFFCEGTPLAPLVAGNQTMASISDGTTTNFIYCRRNIGVGRMTFYAANGTGATAVQDIPVTPAGSHTKTAGVFDTVANTMTIAFTSSYSQTKTITTMPSGLDTIKIGIQGNDAVPLIGFVTRIIFWPTKLSLAELLQVVR
jgi:hypothetical protein